MKNRKPGDLIVIQNKRKLQNSMVRDQYNILRVRLNYYWCLNTATGVEVPIRYSELLEFDSLFVLSQNPKGMTLWGAVMTREVQWMRTNSQAMVDRVGIRVACRFPEFVPLDFTDEQIRGRLLEDEAIGLDEWYFKDYAERLKV